MSKFHDTEYRQILKRQSELDEQKIEAKLKRRDSKNILAEVNNNTLNLVQLTLPDFTAKATKSSHWPEDHEITRRIDKAIMDLIIVDMLPYSLIEGEAFRRLNLADPSAVCRYNFKSEKYFRMTLMPQTYERVKCKVTDLLAKCEWLSCTTDIWTNPSKTCSLLSFTAHFIVGSQRLKVILGASVLAEKRGEKDHTGEYIGEKLTEIVHE